MRISDWSSDVCSSDLDAAPDFENAGIPGLAQSIERPCILDVFQPVESLERESSKLPEHERVIERAPVFGLSNDIEQNQISVRMLGRSERARSEEHTSELQSLMSISYAVFCLKTQANIHLVSSTHTVSLMNTNET